MWGKIMKDYLYRAMLEDDLITESSYDATNEKKSYMFTRHEWGALLIGLGVVLIIIGAFLV